MAHDVFISYSSIDKTAADTVCSILEQNGISCWMAPRDITPGLDFAEAIIDGIKSSKLFILVYSSNSNNSKQVIREVDRAVHLGLPVINLRLEDVPLSKQLEYYLSSVHWLDAMTPPLEKHIKTLSGVVLSLLRKGDAGDDDLKKAIRDGTLRVGQDKKSIAVLPFINDSPDQENTYFINGVMEEILNNLQKIKDLRVISRTSVEQYRDKKKPLSEIAQELGVNYIVEGSGQKYGNSFRLRAQLIMAKHESHLWGESFQQKINNVEDIFNIQIRIAESIAAELKAVITPAEKLLIEKIPTKQIEAYEAFLKGRFYVYKLTTSDLETAMKYFELSKEKDPEYAPAYAGISFVWTGLMQMGHISPEEAGPKIMEALMRAAELDNTNAEVIYTQACINTWMLWDWESGESAFKKALELNPNHAEAHAYYSHFLNIMGKPEEAFAEIEIALKLDPHNPLLISLHSVDLYYLRRFEEAIMAAKKALQMEPVSPVAQSALHDLLHLTGRYDEAWESVKNEWMSLGKGQAFDLDFNELGYVRALNKAAESLEKASESAYINPILLANVYLMAGNKEKSLELMEKAYEIRETNLPYLLLGIFDIVRDEPRFQEIANKMNIPYK